MSYILQQAAVPALEPLRELIGYPELEAERAITLQAEARSRPYALDPKLPLIEGRVKVWDPDRLAFVPFLAWPHQLETLDSWIHIEADTLRFKNTHIEKSRQMGDTVILAYACLWVVTYWDAPLMMQHQKVQEVADGGDNATWDSFFGKIRLMWNTWDPEIGKARLKFRGGNDPLITNLDHPARFITGDGATPDPGRGGRYAGAVIDEAARIAYGESAHAALARACPQGRVYLSTPEGEGNMYFRIRNERPAGWQFLRHHWSTHPVYGHGQHVAASDPTCVLCQANVDGVRWDPQNPRCHRYPGKLTSPWYDQAVIEFTDEQVAAELDIDYAASLGARVYPEFSEDVHVPDEPIPYEPATDLQFFFDYGLDTTSILIVQETHDMLRVIGEWEGHDLTPEQNTAGVVDVLEQLGVPEMLTRPEWRLRNIAIGDPAGEARELGSGRPLTAIYRAAGFNIQSRPFPVATTIVATKRLLMGRPKLFRVSSRCVHGIAHLKGNVWPTDKHGTRKPGVTAPLDNEHNHWCRALAYGVTYKWPEVPMEFEPHGRVVETEETRRRERALARLEGGADHVAYDEMF